VHTSDCSKKPRIVDYEWPVGDVDTPENVKTNIGCLALAREYQHETPCYIGRTMNCLMRKPIDQALDDASANLVISGLKHIFSAKKKYM
jgi:hypothetical protein